MKTVVITGGIGCGKSWVATALGSLNASFRYSADEAIHAAYEDPAIRSKIAKALNLPDTDQDLSGKELRRAIRPRVMTDRSAKSTLEEILHPMARHSFLETRRLANDAGAKLLVAEIPLYYETGAAFDGDVVVVVAASRSTQLRRLQFYRSLDVQTAEEMLSMQMPMDEKVQRADVVIWNDGSLDALEAELSVLHHAIS